jgi:uncharacterized metal-binding protein (TIGR02443 family)
MNDSKINKRFIAGAVCPRCSEMDKLMMYLDAQQQQVRECVRCGYQDVMTDNGPRKIATEEITTRVNQPRVGEPTLAHEDEIQIVSIVDPNPGARRRDH